LERAHRVDHRVEEIEQQEQDIIVKVQFAVVGLIARAADGMQLGKEPGHMLELLEAAQLLEGYRRHVGGFGIALLAHAGIMRKVSKSRKYDIAPHLVASRRTRDIAPHLPPGANGVPNGIGTWLFYRLCAPRNLFRRHSARSRCPLQAHLLVRLLRPVGIA
jgi:hypothetical protein